MYYETTYVYITKRETVNLDRCQSRDTKWFELRQRGPHSN